MASFCDLGFILSVRDEDGAEQSLREAGRRIRAAGLPSGGSEELPQDFFKAAEPGLEILI